MDAKAQVMSRLKTFSPLHESYITAVLIEILSHYGENLSGLAIFGSYARGENRKNSDLDLLIILQKAPGRRERLVEFIEDVELKHEDRAQRLYEDENILCELSPYILTEAEALKVQPIYFDLVTHHVVVHDPKGVVAHIIATMETLLREIGARRVRRSNTWEWQTKRFLGGVEL